MNQIFLQAPDGAYIDRFRVFVRETDYPENWPGLDHAPLPQEGGHELLASFSVSEARTRDPESRIPCSSCSNDTPKFGHGCLVWSDADCKIRLIGKDCARRHIGDLQFRQMNDRYKKRVMSSAGRERLQIFIRSLAETKIMVAALDRRKMDLEIIKKRFWGNDESGKRELLLKYCNEHNFHVFDWVSAPKLDKKNRPKLDSFGLPLYTQEWKAVGEIAGKMFLQRSSDQLLAEKEKKFLEEVGTIKSVLGLVDDEALRLSKAAKNLQSKLEDIDNELLLARRFLLPDNLKKINMVLAQNNVPELELDTKNAQIETDSGDWLDLRDLQAIAA